MGTAINSDGGSDQYVLSNNFEDEVDINIHFHCEHCFKIGKCKEISKQGWSCDIVNCIQGCGFRFHRCKLDEHELLCSHVKVPCLNQKNGCPQSLLRKNISEHLVNCPASIIVCNSEWNRWAMGARKREKIAPCSGYTSLYNNEDLDVSFALEDQKLVNELHYEPNNLRRVLCNSITQRFPSLPLTVRGTYRDGYKIQNESNGNLQSKFDANKEALIPVRATLPLIENAPINDVNQSLWNVNRSEIERGSIGDISAYCCTHGIIKDICKFCKNDPDEPNFKINYVWREKLAFNTPGKLNWAKEPRIEKVRMQGPLGIFIYKTLEDSDDEDKVQMYKKLQLENNCKSAGMWKRLRTPSPAPLNAKSLNIELVPKDYSKYQMKPQAMFTFQCMQEVRRDQYSAHYQNLHSEIQEGLDGWIMERCPLHIFGCPFSVGKMQPYEKGILRFSNQMNCFGVTLTDDIFPPKNVQPVRGESSIERSLPSFKEASEYISTSLSKSSGSIKFVDDKTDSITELNLLMLPIEILKKIVSNLDAYTLNILSMTCQILRDVAFSFLYEKGLVIQDWIRFTGSDGVVRWSNGYNRWFFSKTFSFVDHWRYTNLGSVANHLSECPFNIRHKSKTKFNYTENYTEKVYKRREKIIPGCFIKI